MDHVVGARWNTLALAFHWHAQHYVAITGCPANNACATRLGMVEPQRRETARRPEAQRRAARVAPNAEGQRAGEPASLRSEPSVPPTRMMSCNTIHSPALLEYRCMLR